jgi:ComF family protein
VIHGLKYQKRQEIGVKIGRLYAQQLIAADSLIKDIDLIVPVPLHSNRLKSRGFNQSDTFALGLSQVMGIPYEADALARTKENVTQTKKSRYDRWGNVEGIFELRKPELITGKHILLVDDVVTTGATIESCAVTLLQTENVRLSIATMATAGR